MNSVVVDDPWEVERRLTELELNSHGLREAVRAGLLESLACTEYDPLSARGYELWRMASRRLREVFGDGPDPAWRALDERNQPLIVNPSSQLAVTVSSGDDRVGDPNPERPPSTRNPKGQVTVDLVEKNEQFLLFPGKPAFVRSPKPSERMTWILLIWASGSEGRCELSLPRAIANRHIVDWRERIILEPVLLDEAPLDFDATTDGSSGPAEVPVSRKPGA